MVKSRGWTYQRIPRQLSTKWATLNNGNNKQDQEKTVPGRLVRQLCKEQLLHAAPAGQETSAENAFENAKAEPSPDAEKHKRSQTHVNLKEMRSKHLVTQPNQPAGTKTLRE